MSRCPSPQIEDGFVTAAVWHVHRRTELQNVNNASARIEPTPACGTVVDELQHRRPGCRRAVSRSSSRCGHDIKAHLVRNPRHAVGHGRALPESSPRSPPIRLVPALFRAVDVAAPQLSDTPQRAGRREVRPPASNSMTPVATPDCRRGTGWPTSTAAPACKYSSTTPPPPDPRTPTSSRARVQRGGWPTRQSLRPTVPRHQPTSHDRRGSALATTPDHQQG